MANGRRVSPAVKFNGKNVSVSLATFLRRISYEDPAEGESDTVSIERGAKLEGRNMTMIVAPKAQKSSGKNKKKQQQEKPATQGGNTHAEN